MKNLATLISSFMSLATLAQPALTWEKTYGGAWYEIGYSVDQTSDGGLVIAGFNWSTDGDVAGHHGSVSESDGWVLKLGANGDTLWTRSLGGSRSEYANAILETPDLGFIVAGQAMSTDGDVWDHHGAVWYDDVWLVKLDAGGDTLWTRSYGGTDDDYAYAIDISADGGFMVGGTSRSTDEDVWDNNGGWDFWILKTNGVGDTIWTRSFGGTSSDYCEAIKATDDGGCVAAGWTYSNDGDVSGNHGSRDGWVIKIDSLGNLEWQRALGGTGWDYAQAVEIAADGNYIIGGTADSQNGDVWDNNGWYDYWVVKLNTLGDTLWTRSFGGTRDDFLRSLKRTCDNGYIMVGSSTSDDGDVSGHHGAVDSLDGWIVKINESGILQWEMSYGGTRPDMFYGVTQTDDGFYVATGYSKSTDGDVSANKGINDLWAVKMRANVSSPQICLVTVDSVTKKNVVVWEKTAYPAVSYNIYKEGISAGLFNLIANVPYDSLSIYVDAASNPAQKSNRYRISSLDSCGFESDTSVIHKTMHLSSSLSPNQDAVNLTWAGDGYEGFTFGTYIIYRKIGAGTLDSIDAIPNNIYSYTDSITPDSSGVFYTLAVVHPSGGCTADKSKNYNSSKSNTSSISAGTVPLSGSASATSATQGNCDGSATATVTGGAPPYAYLWSDPSAQTAVTANGLCTGSYSVTVTDFSGDTVVLNVTVSETASALAATAAGTAADAVLCNGTATVTPTGGTTPYSYLWNGAAGFQVTATAVGLCPGIYSVIVTDATGDTAGVTVTVSSLTVVGPSAYAPGLSVYPNPNSGTFVLELAATGSPEGMVYVYNTLGRLILELPVTAKVTRIDLDGVVSGMIAVKLVTAEAVFIRSIIIH